MRAILLIVFIAALSTRASAQTLSQEWMRDGVFSIDVMRPFFDDDDPDFPSSGFFNLRLPLGSVALLADLPYATVNTPTITGGTVNSRAIGNIMIGVEGRRGNIALTGSIRLPTAPLGEPALGLGSFGDVHRFEAFFPDQLSLRGGLNYRPARTNAVNADLGAALVILVESDEETVGESEAFIDYGILFVHRPRAWGVSGGLAGRALITEGELTFDQRTAHEVRFTVDYTTSRVRPYLGATIPLDEGARDIVPWVLRVGLQVAFH
jgi:hypothetical protein